MAQDHASISSKFRSFGLDLLLALAMLAAFFALAGALTLHWASIVAFDGRMVAWATMDGGSAWQPIWIIFAASWGVAWALSRLSSLSPAEPSDPERRAMFAARVLFWPAYAFWLVGEQAFFATAALRHDQEAFSAFLPGCDLLAVGLCCAGILAGVWAFLLIMVDLAFPHAWLIKTKNPAA